MILEACIESLDEAIYAEKAGAHILEVCSDLSLDGLSPSIDLVKEIQRHITLPLKIMIRPEPDSFEYTSKTFEVMKNQIQRFSKENVNGFVFGILDENKSLHLPAIRHLLSLCDGFSVTIHKAIDQCPDPVKEVSRLKGLHSELFVLSSGAQETAFKGAEVLNKMITVGQPNVKIIAAGKITKDNLSKHKALLKTSLFHGRRIV